MSEPETEEDWGSEGVKERGDIKRAAIEIAKLHTIFTLDERGRALLEMWRATARQRVPVNATLDQYARAEAMRTFVDVIEDQLRIAAKEGK